MGKKPFVESIAHATEHHTPSPKERARFRSMKPGFSGPGPRCCKMFNQKQTVSIGSALGTAAIAHPRLHFPQSLVTVTTQCGPFRQHYTMLFKTRRLVRITLYKSFSISLATPSRLFTGLSLGVSLDKQLHAWKHND